MRIFAIGQDPYWLATIKRLKVKDVTFEAIQCPDVLLECLDFLPTPEVDSLILVDASGQADIVETIRKLRNQRWRYVVVVAADQNAKKAISVLRSNLAFDYWEKTLDIPPIQARIIRSIDEIARGRGL